MNPDARPAPAISNPYRGQVSRLPKRKRFDGVRTVLAQWRGIDLAEAERGQVSSAKATGLIMPAVLAKLGLDRRRTEAELLRVWNHLIDPNIVAHAQPTGLRNGTLFVTVDHSVWLSEIVRYRRKEILERLQHSFGRDLIARISFRL